MLEGSLGLWAEKDAILYMQSSGHGFTDSDIEVESIGDGNINQVFRLKNGSRSLIVKRAPPFLKCVGESWPLSQERIGFELQYLLFAKTLAAEYLPAIYHHSPETILMEDLAPRENARYGLMARKVFPTLGKDIGNYCATMAFYTSDFGMPQAVKRRKIAEFIANVDTCKITEDLFFTDPYYDSTTNRFSPELRGEMEALWQNTAFKKEVAVLKQRFCHDAEALIHGDLHTGSLLVTPGETKIIDAEFATFGPIGFDLGTFIANLLINHIAQVGHGGDATQYQAYLWQQVERAWQSFSTQFKTLAATQAVDASLKSSESVDAFLEKVWRDALGFAGTECIRRTVGLAHVKEIDSIAEPAVRLRVEKMTLSLGVKLIQEREHIPNYIVLKALLDQVSHGHDAGPSASSLLFCESLETHYVDLRDEAKWSRE